MSGFHTDSIYVGKPCRMELDGFLLYSEGHLAGVGNITQLNYFNGSLRKLALKLYRDLSVGSDMHIIDEKKDIPRTGNTDVLIPETKKFICPLGEPETLMLEYMIEGLQNGRIRPEALESYK